MYHQITGCAEYCSPWLWSGSWTARCSLEAPGRFMVFFEVHLPIFSTEKKTSCSDLDTFELFPFQILTRIIPTIPKIRIAEQLIMSCWPALQPSHHSRLSGLLLAFWAKNFYCKRLLQKQHWANRIWSVFFPATISVWNISIELASASLCLLSLFLFQSRQTLPSARSLEKNLDPTIKVSSTNLDTNLQNRQDFMLIRCSYYF